ncbi:MAG: DciA family protein [Methylococcaceae bacterium]|jgi:hypothetical protein|nr:DciA family protein [Methylococcaceae bacterium]MDZ4157675.1 DciA family protein [Methylococcales bacterium]MDP2393073.1 DciA family protein [Methylococcaceae bacterium]MDP3019217.1 DciA family protein [Methylococcaceae bacterium]MDP3389202.1 DciA family protein [Methylococcaceae bacterium]
MIKKHNAFKPALLFPNNALAYVYSQIELQRQLLHPVRNALPSILSMHVLHCIIKKKELIVFTDTASWASQLRFYHDAMIASIALLTRESVNALQIRVMPVLTGIKSRQAPSPIIPSTEKIMLIRSTGMMSSDEHLKQALIKLSTTLQRLADKN